MAVCPLRSNGLLSLGRIPLKRSLGLLSRPATKDGHSRFVQKAPSTLLQVFVKESPLDRDAHKNSEFLFLLRSNLQQILHKRTRLLLGSLEEDRYQGENLLAFGKLQARMGLQELSEDELKRLLPAGSTTAYMPVDGPFDYLKVYVSNKVVPPSERSGFLLFERFFGKPRFYNRALVLCRRSKNKQVILKSFVRLASNKVLGTLPGAAVRGDAFRKIFLSALVGLSLGSASATAISEVFCLPSQAFACATAVAVLSSSLVWGSSRDAQSSLLLDKIRTLFDSSRSNGSVVSQLMVREIVLKVLLETLSLYSFLLREEELMKRRGGTSDHLEVDDALRRNFYVSSCRLLGPERGGNANLVDLLFLLEELEMVRLKDASLTRLEVVPFDAALLSLRNRPANLCDRLEL